MKTLKLMCWNVNGLRAVLKKGFMDVLVSQSPDLMGIQETKIQENQLPDVIKEIPGYESAWSYAEKKGYSGTAVFFKERPLSITSSFEAPELNGEGRILQTDFEAFTLFNIYFPNGQMSEERLNYKLSFYDRCLEYFEQLRAEGRKLIIMGDYNTAHKEIDLKNPKKNEENSGFLPVERAWLDKFVAAGYVDTFREFCTEPEQYTWWSYRFKAREKNIGWRIDYFFVSREMLPHVEESYILPDIQGSDHCPIVLKIKI